MPAGETFQRVSDAFETPHFKRVNRQWLKEGDGALNGSKASSSLIAMTISLPWLTSSD